MGGVLLNDYGNSILEDSQNRPTGKCSGSSVIFAKRGSVELRVIIQLMVLTAFEGVEEGSKISVS